MKVINSTIVLFLISISLVVTVGAQTKQKKAVSKSQPSPDERMRRDMQVAAPGPPHARLASLAGEYTTVSKFYVQPGAPAMESTGEAKLSMTLDGRFLVEDNSGTFMNQPLKGFRLLGYNNASKQYEGVWTYTMSTAIMTLNGTAADRGRTINLAASFNGVGAAKEKLVVIMRLNDDDHFEVELSGKTPVGKPGPRQVTAYARRK